MAFDDYQNQMFMEWLRQRQGGGAPGLIPLQAGADVSPEISQDPSQIPSMEQGVPPGGIVGGAGRTLPNLGELYNKMGVDKPEKDQYGGMMLPMMMTQIGAALMAHPDQRAAMFGNIPTTMLAIQKMQQTASNEKKMMDLYGKIYGGKAGTAGAFDKEWWTNEAGESRQFPPGGPVPAGWTRTKEPIPKENKPLTRTIPRGNEKVAQEYDYDTGTWKDVSSGPQWNPKSQGVTVTLKDGTIVSTGGESGKAGGSATGLPKPIETEVYKELDAALISRRDTNQLAASYKPEYSTFGGQLGSGWSTLKEKAGFELNPDDTKKLADYTAWRSSAWDMANSMLKRLSGTAVTANEMERQMKVLVNPDSGSFFGDSPTQVKSKLERMKGFYNNTVARLNYIRKNNYSIRNAAGELDFADISLDRMPAVIKGYGQDLGKKLMQQNGWKEDDPRLKNAVLNQTAEYFGLVY